MGVELLAKRLENKTDVLPHGKNAPKNEVIRE